MASDEHIECGRYVLRSRIGAGAMAEVWRATHVDWETDAAVKFVAPEGFKSPRRRRRFQREISSHASLHHPHIVDILGTGEADARTERTSGGALEAGRPYLAMEYTEIGSLRNYLPVPDWRDLRTLLFQLLAALGHAHAHHIIHRDLKPGNVLVFATDDGVRLKISDFGMAHATSREYARGTDQVPMPSGGTPVYMAPEQLRANWRDFGPWTDLYTLGILAFEIACAHPPYLGDDFFELAEKHLSSEPLVLDPVVPTPDGFETWVQTLTAANPADRFRSAADAARSLEALDSPDSDALDRDFEIRNTVDLSNREPVESTVTQRDALHFPGTSSPSRDSIRAQSDFGREDERLDLDELARESTDLDHGFPREIPNDWREPPTLERSTRRNIDLELCHLIEPKLVGRERERDILWEAAVEVFETGEPRTVDIRGTNGVGKTRLAKWLVRHLREMGLYRSLETLHLRNEGPLDALRRLVEHRFRTWNLPRSEIYNHLQRALERQLGLPRETLREHDEIVRGLTEFLRPTPAGAPPDEHDYYFGSRAEQYTLLYRLLALIGHDRPVVVRIDDVPGSSVTADWVARSLDEGELPVLWLLTSDGDSDPLPDRLTDRPSTRTIDLGGLSPPDQQALVESLVPVDDVLAERVRSQTHGSPVFAIHMIRKWAQAGYLEPGADGYVLADPEAPRAPDSLGELWQYRVDALLEGLPKSKRRDARVALETAAALGRNVEFADWTDIVERLELDVSPSLVEALSRQGLVELVQTGWQFTHRTLVRSLREGARRGGRWARIQGALARWLDETTDRHTKHSAERTAHHWIAAGDIGRAVEHLEKAVDLARGHREHERLERLLDLHEEQLEALSASEATPHRLYNAIQRVPLELFRGNSEAAREWLNEGFELAQTGDFALEYAHLQRSDALIRRHEGDMQSCLALLDEALSQFRELSDDIGLAETHRERGIALALTGSPGEAIDELDRASAYYLADGDELRSLNTKVWQGTVYIFSDALEHAEHLAESLLDRATDLGAPSTAVDAHNLLGDVARFRGDPDAAREHYRRAIRQGTKIGAVSPQHRLNLCFAELEAGDLDAAVEILDDLESAPAEFLGDRHGIYSALVRAVAAADDGRWAEWDDYFHDASEAADRILRRSDVDRDPAWLARRASEITREAGGPERADELENLADRLRDWFKAA